MKTILFIAGVVLTCLMTASLWAESITIQYGTVTHVQTVDKKARHAGGALAGGVLGVLAGDDHKGFAALAGAGVGAAVQGAATSGKQQQYTVSMINGGTTLIDTEQMNIRVGDCVAIEQGKHSNIRRISTVHCEVKTQAPPPHHQSITSDCEKSKHELANAKTDEAITLAAKKVRILCED